MRRLSSFALMSVIGLSVAVAGCDVQTWLPGKKPAAEQPIANNAFSGTVQAEFLLPSAAQDYYRDMKLLAPFVFVDAKGTRWEVPAGYVTNGASVPWGLWNIVGGPYDGPYRDAAVLHDYYVDLKTRSWQEVHEMFYNAARARGISETLASTMYAGIRYGGPRWDVVLSPAPAKAQTVVPTAKPVTTAAPKDPGITKRLPTDDEKRIFDQLREWIERTKPSIAEIDKKVEELRRQSGKTPAPVTPPTTPPSAAPAPVTQPAK